MANFAADLSYGKAGEFWVDQLGGAVSIEVKRDRKWATTGNLFFEISCSGKESGVMATEASYFAYILSSGDLNVAMYVWHTDTLKKALQRHLNDGLCKTVKGGDRGAVIGIVYPIKDIGKLLCEGL